MAKTVEKISNKIFVKNAQNVEIYQWNFFEVTHVFTPYKMAQTIVKIFKQNFCQKCSER